MQTSYKLYCTSSAVETAFERALRQSSSKPNRTAQPNQSCLTLSSLGFLEVSQLGGGGGVDSPFHRNFFTIHPKHVKLGPINKWHKLYTAVVSICN